MRAPDVEAACRELTGGGDRALTAGLTPAPCFMPF